MEYRRLGRSGLKVSALSFGSWVSFSNQLDEKSSLECMALAYDRGVNFFDNAEVYAEGQSEVLMGKALKKLNWSRDSYLVSSKVFWGGDKPTQKGLSRKHIQDACTGALKRLQVDYLDLFFCHRPDHECPIEETAFMMDSLIRQGKILYWGTSEWSASQIMEAYGVCRQNSLIPPTMEQPQYNMFHRQRVEVEYQQVYKTCGLGTTIWSPLASGVLTGKYSKGIPSGSRSTISGFEWLKERVESEEGKHRIALVDKLSSLAKEVGVSVAQLAILWCLKNQDVSTVILGASKSTQLDETLGVLDFMDKTEGAVWEQVEEVINNRPDPEIVYS